jgi:uncharacterized protein
MKDVIPLYLETRYGIHTFFVRRTIDIVILNSNFKVVTLKKNLKPNRIYFWNPLYFRILELPAGFINKTGIKKGSSILLSFC